MVKRLTAIAALLVVMTAAGALAQYLPPVPGLIIDPTSGSAGQTISVSGQGCEPGTSVVFTINGQVIGTVPVSGTPTSSTPGTAGTTIPDPNAGTFSGTITIPSDLPPGTYTIIGTCGDASMSATFTVLGNEVLPVTGSDSTLPLARAGLLLVVVGGLLALAFRRRHETRSSG